MVRPHSADDVCFGHVEYDTSGEFEEHFEKGDGPDAGAGFLAEWFDLSNKPKIGNVLWYCALSPSEHPESCGLNAVGCFESCSDVCVLRALEQQGWKASLSCRMRLETAL